MKLTAFALLPALTLAGCGPGVGDLAQSVVAAGVGYHIGRQVEKNARDDDRVRPVFRQTCRGDRFDGPNCVPRYRYDRDSGRHDRTYRNLDGWP